ncbi:MAG: hypothetical protein EP298_01915 [Gammaproteobacteria bacterium]|nr:MAG: hypothetical protein EP298_01915 [Gammaproteobacteria bacterium]UTW41395.1 hypothetical protein KFE69_07685 [bacterium SCSIO 12844]
MRYSNLVKLLLCFILSSSISFANTNSNEENFINDLIYANKPLQESDLTNPCNNTNIENRSMYTQWVCKSAISTNTQDQNYLVIGSNGGQSAGHQATSEGIGFGIIISAGVMKILKTENKESTPLYQFAQQVFTNNYQYLKNANKDRSSYPDHLNDGLYAWAYDNGKISSSPYSDTSASDGDMYIAAGLIIAGEVTGNTSLKNEGNNAASAILAHDVSSSGDYPNTVQIGDGANNGSLQNTQPSKAIFPLMYLFKNTTSSTSEKQKWQLVIQQTLNFIKIQLPNYHNLLPYFGNYSYQYGSDSARNAMNLGGLIIAINNDKITTQDDIDNLHLAQDNLTNLINALSQYSTTIWLSGQQYANIPTEVDNINTSPHASGQWTNSEYLSTTLTALEALGNSNHSQFNFNELLTVIYPQYTVAQEGNNAPFNVGIRGLSDLIASNQFN